MADNFVKQPEMRRNGLKRSKMTFLTLKQCCETAPQFFMAYGLWRVMAFFFMAYGGESKIDEKAIIRIIRRNTARLVFLSKKTAKCGLF